MQYDKWSAALKSQRQTMSFSCSWPAYYDFCTEHAGRHPNASACGHNPWAPGPSNTHLAEICQLWRYGADSDAGWNHAIGNVAQILESATTGKPYLDTPFHKLVDTGPGSWNDADFISAGCPTDRKCGLGENVATPMTALEQRTQMSMWAMIASPIIIGSDVRFFPPRFFLGCACPRTRVFFFAPQPMPPLAATIPAQPRPPARCSPSRPPPGPARPPGARCCCSDSDCHSHCAAVSCRSGDLSDCVSGPHGLFISDPEPYRWLSTLKVGNRNHTSELLESSR